MHRRAARCHRVVDVAAVENGRGFEIAAHLHAHVRAQGRVQRERIVEHDLVALDCILARPPQPAAPVQPRADLQCAQSRQAQHQRHVPIQVMTQPGIVILGMPVIGDQIGAAARRRGIAARHHGLVADVRLPEPGVDTRVQPALARPPSPPLPAPADCRNAVPPPAWAALPFPGRDRTRWPARATAPRAIPEWPKRSRPAGAPTHHRPAGRPCM